jgi:hypothetical protein
MDCHIDKMCVSAAKVQEGYRKDQRKLRIFLNKVKLYSYNLN